jgi:hypothetical protein
VIRNRTSRYLRPYLQLVNNSKGVFSKNIFA